MKILLTGGSACGKSTYAEKLALSFSKKHLYYVATMRPYDDECLKKIEKHRLARKDNSFITLEQPTDIHTLSIEKDSCVLLECICNLCANEMFDEQGNMTDPVSKITEGIEALSCKCEHLIVVTNNVGSDLNGSYAPSTLAYIEAISQINNCIAKDFDHVYELVCSIPFVLKGRLLI